MITMVRPRIAVASDPVVITATALIVTNPVALSSPLAAVGSRAHLQQPCRLPDITAIGLLHLHDERECRHGTCHDEAVNSLGNLPQLLRSRFL